MKPGVNQRGAAIVEFAVLFLLLMVFVFGIIEFGFIWLQSHYVANAAREGARVASNLTDLTEVNGEAPPRPKIEAAVADYLQGLYRNLDAGSEVGFRCCSVPDPIPDPPGTPAAKFVEIAVQSGPLSTFTGEAEDPDPDAVKIFVTVQTARVWEPILWDLLNLIPGAALGEIRQVTETAVFAKLN